MVGFDFQGASVLLCIAWDGEEILYFHEKYTWIITSSLNSFKEVKTNPRWDAFLISQYSWECVTADLAMPFLHVGPHPITSALSGLSPRGTIDFSHAGFLLMTQHIVQPISKAFPTPASPGALHACGVCMSGFDLEAKHGSVPGLRVSYTRRWAKPSSCRPFTCLEPQRFWDHWAPENSWPFELTFFGRHPDHRFLSLFLHMLLISNFLKSHRIINTQHLFCKSNMNLFGGKHLTWLNMRLFIIFIYPI